MSKGINKANKKSKKGKQKETPQSVYKPQKRWGAFVISISSLVIVILISVLDACLFKKLITDYDNILPKPSAMIIVLIPAILALISICLSLYKEKIYGASINEINTLRGPFYFNFIYISIIMAVAIGLYAFLVEGFDLRITNYVLSLIAFCFSIGFLVQEIPLMIMKRHNISRILRSFYKRRGASYDILTSQKDQQIFTNVVQNVLMSEGIRAVFKTLSDKGNERKTLLYLIEQQDNFFTHFAEELSSKENSNIIFTDQITPLEIIQKGYSNFENIVSGDDGFDYKKILKHGDYYYVSFLVLDLHEISERYGYVKNEKEKLVKFIDDYLTESSIGNKNDISEFVIIWLSAYTLERGEIWFVRPLRDNQFISPYSLFDLEKRPVGLLISMMIAHLLKHNALSEKEKDELKKFIREESDGLNSGGENWTELLKYPLLIQSFENVMDSLNTLLEMYRSLNETSFYFHGKRKSPFYSADDNFTEADLIDMWIDMLFVSVEEKTFEKTMLFAFLQGLDDKAKESLYECLNNKWFKDGMPRNDIDFSFIEFMCPYLNIESIRNNPNRKIIETLDEFRQGELKKEAISHIHQEEASPKEGLDMIVEKMNGVFAFVNEAFPKPDESDEQISMQKRYYGFCINKHHWKAILNAYLDRMPDSMLLLLGKNIEESQIIKRERGSGELSDEDVKAILNFEPDYTSEDFRIDEYCYEQKTYSKELKQLDIKSVNCLPRMLYFKKDGIKFLGKVDEENTCIRSLKGTEIDKYIEDNYQALDNGLYRYSEYHDDKQHSFLVTREELVDFIKDGILYVRIVFEYSLQIDTEKCLLFTVKDENDE